MNKIERLKQKIISKHEVYSYSNIAKYLGIDVSNLVKAVKGQNGSNGTPIKLSSEHEAKLIEYCKSNNIK